MLNTTKKYSGIYWSDSLEFMTLQRDEIHLWRIVIDAAVRSLESFLDVLSTDETARYHRYHFQKDKVRFAATRGLLRVILGRYQATDPKKIHFTYNAYGKPFLGADESSDGLQFNISHADNLAYIAVTVDRRVGVDIEKIKSAVEMDIIAERHFTRQEVAHAKRYAGAQRRKALWELWTCKEAFVKALGKGLSFPLDAFDIAGTMEETVCCTVHQHESCFWSIVKICPHPDYVGALAVEGELTRVLCHDAEKILCMNEF